MITTIASFPTSWEADIAIAMLRENGLHPFDLQSASHIKIAGAEQVYYITIPDFEAEAAAEYLISNGCGNNVISTR